MERIAHQLGAFSAINKMNSLFFRLAILAIGLLQIGTARATYQEWRAAKFLAAEQGVEAISGEDADPDHDQISNFLEYALGTEPKAGDKSTSTLERDGDLLHFRFPHGERPELTYALQQSADCITWSCPDSVTWRVKPFTFEGKRTGEFRINKPNATRCFYRLAVGRFTITPTDSDGDGLEDQLELQYFGSLNSKGTDDTDGDGIINLDEFTCFSRSNPALPDSDGDGMGDGDEAERGYDPSSASEFPPSVTVTFIVRQLLSTNGTINSPSGTITVGNNTVRATFNRTLDEGGVPIVTVGTPRTDQFTARVRFNLPAGSSYRVTGDIKSRIVALGPLAFDFSRFELADAVEDGIWLTQNVSGYSDTTGLAVSGFIFMPPAVKVPSALSVNGDFDEDKVVEGKRLAMDFEDASPFSVTNGMPQLGDFKEVVIQGSSGAYQVYLSTEAPADLERGAIRIHAFRWSDQNWVMVTPEDNVAALAAQGFQIYLEGSQEGWVKLVWTMSQYGQSRDEVLIDVCTRQSKAAWQELVRQRVIFETGFDVNAYDVEKTFTRNSSIVVALYEFYKNVYLSDPSLLWSGIARMAGGPVYGGLSDVEQIHIAKSNHITHPQQIFIFMPLAEATEARRQGMAINRAIFFDLAWQHQAFVSSGLRAIKHVADSAPSATDLGAWEKIASGKRTSSTPLVIEGNHDLIIREQKIIAQPYWNQILLLPYINEEGNDYAFNPLNHTLAHQHYSDFREFDPDGYLSNYQHRLAWIDHAWASWNSLTPASREALVREPLIPKAKLFSSSWLPFTDPQ